MQPLLDTPWRVTNELRRYAALPYIRLMLALHGLHWGCGWRMLGMPLIKGYRGSVMEFGARTGTALVALIRSAGPRSTVHLLHAHGTGRHPGGAALRFHGCDGRGV